MSNANTIPTAGEKFNVNGPHTSEQFGQRARVRDAAKRVMAEMDKLKAEMITAELFDAMTHSEMDMIQNVLAAKMAAVTVAARLAAKTLADGPPSLVG